MKSRAGAATVVVRVADLPRYVLAYSPRRAAPDIRVVAGLLGQSLTPTPFSWIAFTIRLPIASRDKNTRGLVRWSGASLVPVDNQWSAAMRLPGIPTWMTPKMVEVMLDHVDGTAPITTDQIRSIAVSECISRGLIRYKEDRAIRPRNTIITEPGREALCLILASWADELTTLGFEAQERAFQLQYRAEYRKSGLGSYPIILERSAN